MYERIYDVYVLDGTVPQIADQRAFPFPGTGDGDVGEGQVADGTLPAVTDDSAGTPVRREVHVGNSPSVTFDGALERMEGERGVGHVIGLHPHGYEFDTGEVEVLGEGDGLAFEGVAGIYLCRQPVPLLGSADRIDIVHLFHLVGRCRRYGFDLERIDRIAFEDEPFAEKPFDV